MSHTSHMGCSHNCSGCSSSCHTAATPVHLLPNDASHIHTVIGISSGKGGVGKSLVTCLLANELARRGKKVGILDADITGPSIPYAFGVRDELCADSKGIFPAISNRGIKIMSVNLLLKNDTDPVAWRGPVISGIINQFFTEVNWGNLDVLLVDMPPGTSDATLTILQKLPLDGLICVCGATELSEMIVQKAASLAKSIGVEHIGFVRNMAYYLCPDCSSKHYPFGKPDTTRIMTEISGETACAFAELPIREDIALHIDAGTIESCNVSEELSAIISAIEERIAPL